MSTVGTIDQGDYARPWMSDRSTAAERLQFLRTLRAIRDFRPDPVPDPALQAILEVARWSGSASNRQPWDLVVVRDRERLRDLAAAGPHTGHLARAPLGIVIVMPGDKPQLDAYDEARMAERILLAAHAQRLAGSIGWFSGEAARETARTILGVPHDRLVRTAISIGYPTEAALRPKAAPGKARRPLDSIVHWERYVPAPSGGDGGDEG